LFGSSGSGAGRAGQEARHLDLVAGHAAVGGQALSAIAPGENEMSRDRPREGARVRSAQAAIPLADRASIVA
jgi:hypothetical protein